MGFYARILIPMMEEKMIEELNEELKSMYLEPRNKLRVDVDYVIGRLEHIVNSVFLHSDVLKLDTDIEEFINELKQNMENHNGN